MSLGERKFLILRAIIDDYIMTAVPVGSRTVSRKSGVGFSPATIRNEMSDLEELGYLAQPHASAGRFPSAKAYRLYVDRLMRVNELTEAETHEIRGHLNARASQVEQIIRHAAQAISDITQYAAVIAQPDVNEMPIRRMQLVPVTDSTALMVVVMGEGLVKEAVIHVPDGIAPDHLYFISGMLTERLNGAYPSDFNARFSHIFSDLSLNRELMAEVLSTLTHQAKEGADVPIVVGGSTNLLKYPEYSDVEKAKGFLKVLESREKLYPLLRQAGALEFTIRIGPETNIPEFFESSVVTATYRMGESTKGTLGIIGPTRMNYSRVVSVMSYMGKLISDILNGLSET